MKKHPVRSVIVILIMMLATGCTYSAARAVHRWSAPEGDHARLEHLLIIAVSKSDTVRRSIEDQLHAYLAKRGINSAPSYSVQETIAPEGVLDLARSKGFDGLLVVRLIAREQEIDSVYWESHPGRYPGWNEYSPWSWRNNWQPPTLIESIFLFHESKLIAIDQDKLLFSTLTKAKVPESVEKVVRAVVREVGDEVVESGWLEAGREPE